MLYLIFFIVGICQDICGASWVIYASRKSYMACFWAFLWAGCNCAFVLTVASSLNWFVVPAYASGIAVGSMLVITYQRRNV